MLYAFAAPPMRVASERSGFSIELPDHWQRVWGPEQEELHGFDFGDPVSGLDLQFRELTDAAEPTAAGLVRFLHEEGPACWGGAPPTDIEVTDSDGVIRVSATFRNCGGRDVRQWYVTDGVRGVDAVIWASSADLARWCAAFDAVLSTIRFTPQE